MSGLSVNRKEVMDEELDRIEQAREREHYSLDPRDQPFAEDVDPDDESWRDEPEAEQDEDDRDAVDARMREATRMPADVQAAIAAGVWEEA